MYNPVYCFCTIVTKEYLFKTLALYDSIRRNSDNDFHLWICSMDNPTFNLLSKMNLPGVTVIDVCTIESKILLRAKKNRSLTEYCWTIKASFIKYLLASHKSIKSILYVDSDVFLYSSPSVMFERLTTCDALLTCHNFTPRFNHLFSQKGHFNAGIVGFRNSRNSMRLLNWWEQKCVDWCYDQIAPNRFADQKYLEVISKTYSSISRMSSLGANAAMWNMEGAEINEEQSDVFINGEKLIFFHFSSFFIISENELDIWKWAHPTVEDQVRHIIYSPYINAISNAIRHVKDYGTSPCDFISDNVSRKVVYNYVSI